MSDLISCLSLIVTEYLAVISTYPVSVVIFVTVYVNVFGFQFPVTPCDGNCVNVQFSVTSSEPKTAETVVSHPL